MSTINNKAWNDLFRENKTLATIEKHGLANVSANLMKNYREPRLMAKIDTIEVLPKIFSENKLSILPVKNGEYVIFKDPNYHSYFKFPNDIDKITPLNYRPIKPLSDFDSFSNLEYINESRALDIALMSSIIKNFTEEREIWLTIRGRQYTSGFEILLPSLQKTLQISNVQIEIDAGYETEKAIYIFEAKIGKRGNFNIRQLLFPYLEWKKRTKKEVIPIFFYYTNDLYYFYQFDLGNSLDASRITKQACYQFDDTYRLDLEEIFSTSIFVEGIQRNIPFPQANDLNKVIDTVTLVNQGYSTKEEISDILEFDDRQGDYYANAACFLGLLERRESAFCLSENGKAFLKISSSIKRVEFIAKQLAKRPVFHQVFNQLLNNNLETDSLDQINIKRIIEENTILRGSTPNRRASTVKQWIRWIFNYVE